MKKIIINILNFSFLYIISIFILMLTLAFDFTKIYIPIILFTLGIIFFIVYNFVYKDLKKTKLLKVFRIIFFSFYFFLMVGYLALFFTNMQISSSLELFLFGSLFLGLNYLLEFISYKFKNSISNKPYLYIALTIFLLFAIDPTIIGLAANDYTPFATNIGLVFTFDMIIDSIKLKLKES